jgi:hypothetical protein
MYVYCQMPKKKNSQTLLKGAKTSVVQIVLKSVVLCPRLTAAVRST